MGQAKDINSGFRIEWDLHELGPKPRQAVTQPRASNPRLDFARALATGDIPANAPRIEPEKAA
jgi:hypothetical protein